MLYPLQILNFVFDFDFVPKTPAVQVALLNLAHLFSWRNRNKKYLNTSNCRELSGSASLAVRLFSEKIMVAKLQNLGKIECCYFLGDYSESTTSNTYGTWLWIPHIQILGGIWEIVGMHPIFKGIDCLKAKFFCKWLW